MNLVTILITAVLLILFILAVRYTFRHKNECSACGGNCSSCGGSCRFDPEKVPERFRKKKGGAQ